MTPRDLLAEAFARHVAGWARRAGANDAAVHAASVAAQALSLATSDGHVCIDLAELGASSAPPGSSQAPGPQSLDGETNFAQVPPRNAGASDTAAWRASLAASGTTAVLQTPEEARRTQGAAAAFPLILDAEDRLYLHRDFDFERRLAARIVRARATTELSSARRAFLRQRLDALFAPTTNAPPPGVDGQKLAVALALRQNLVIISGGPGTGKTTTVANLLACLLALDPACRIALAAPTGKAAARMTEALRQRAAHLPADVRAALPASASTVHRLLRAGADGRFRHDAAHPLPIDVLVVDEASMLDLALATRLLEAVPPEARIVLLGDKDQLAAVEAGAVFSELSQEQAFSATCIADLSALTGITADLSDAAPPAEIATRIGEVDRMPEASMPATRGRRPRRNDMAMAPAPDPQGELFESAPPSTAAISAPGAASTRPIPGHAGPLLDSVAWLTRNFRFAPESGIGRLAGLVNVGAAEEAVAWLAAGADEAVRWWQEPGRRPGPATMAALVAGYGDYFRALQADPTDAHAATRAFSHFRVLCAERLGAHGVAGINAEMMRRLHEAIVPTTDTEYADPWQIGRPVIVLANDYVLRLFNGDLGLALPDATGALQVHFPDAEAPGGFRTIAPARLPRHDTAFALTVHKAQGSEFDDVLLLLPPRASRACTRELLYTAITRARRHATIVAPSAVLAAAIATPTQRRTGLLARLREASAEGAT